MTAQVLDHLHRILAFIFMGGASGERLHDSLRFLTNLYPSE